MNWSLAASLGLHVAILAAALVVLPNPNKYDIKPQPAIQVDISNIGDVSKRMAMTKEELEPKDKPAQKKAETIKKSEPAPKVAEKVQKAVKEAAAEPPPPPEVKKEEAKPLDSDPLKDLIKDTVTETPEPKKEEPKKTVEKPKDKPKKPEKKKKPKLDPDEIAAFLNKVDESKAPEQPSLTDAQPVAGEANLQGTDDQLVGTIVDALVSRVKQCWNVPPGAREANMSIRIHFSLNADGSLAGTPEIQNSGSDALFDATANSAVAAIMECQNYELPQDRYDLWKDNTLDFNPNLMFDS